MLNKFKIKKNYFFKDDYFLKLELDNNFDLEVSLKSLLKDKFKKHILIKFFKIKIIIKEKLFFTIIDDLFDLNLFTSNLEFVLNKESKLNYVLKSDSLKTCKDFCGDCYNCKQGERIKKQLIFNFVEPYSYADVKISLNGAGSYFFDLKTIQNHFASNTKSNLIIKSVLSQHANLKSDNLIKVVKDLEKVEASQINKNLLLGYFSKAICIPKLEVESDDVICKHGAAISKLDEEQMFYLLSRGIDYCKARQILIDSFLS